MIPVAAFPALNACLNAASAACLLLGLFFIRGKRIAAHRACMLAALAFSAVFLGCYLYYHARHGITRYPGTGLGLWVYRSILFSHTLLAAPLAVLAPLAALRGLTRQDDRHRRIARFTYPVWLYVSVTGVAVYLLLYRFGGAIP